MTERKKLNGKRVGRGRILDHPVRLSVCLSVCLYASWQGGHGQAVGRWVLGGKAVQWRRLRTAVLAPSRGRGRARAAALGKLTLTFPEERTANNGGRGGRPTGQPATALSARGRDEKLKTSQLAVALEMRSTQQL